MASAPVANITAPFKGLEQPVRGQRIENAARTVTRPIGDTDVNSVQAQPHLQISRKNQR